MAKLTKEQILIKQLKREKSNALPPIARTIARVLKDTKPENPTALEQWENDCDMVIFAILEHHAINDPIVKNEFFEILEK